MAYCWRVEARMRDARRAPFIWQSVDALALIRAAFDGRERATAIAVYVAFTEAANAQRKREGTFVATRRQIGELAGATKPTVDRYAEAFVQLGLLEVEHRREGDVNKPNAWTLIEVEPDEGGGQAADPGVVKQLSQGGQANRTPIQEELQEEHRTDVLEVWQHYVAVARPRVTNLQDGNAKNIAGWLNKGFTVADLKLAVDGLLASDWHRQRGMTGISYLWKTGKDQPAAIDTLQRFIADGLKVSSSMPSAPKLNNPRVSQARQDIERWYASPRTSNSLRASYEGAVRILQGLGLAYVIDGQNGKASIVAIDQAKG